MHMYVLVPSENFSLKFYNCKSHFTLPLSRVSLCSRYEINAVPLHQKSKDSDCEQSEASCIATSTKVTDLRIGVASFCKAFPWHFVTDKRLELVQLGMYIFSYVQEYQ